MIATDVSDILFGTPAPVRGRRSTWACSKDDKVNIVVHGHEPTLERDDRGGHAGPRD